MTMSSKSNPSGIMIKKKTKKTRKPARRTRTKTRKPKYLSLRLQLSSDKTQQSSDHMSCSTATTTSSNKSHQQLNLFPLHPENLVEEKDTHDENMAYLFSAADGGATTLTGLLGAASRSTSDDENKYHQSTEVSPSASLTYAYEGQEREREEVALVRTALRNKERDSSEEIFVRYSEVVERRSDEEVTSCDAGCRRNSETRKLQPQRLSLKLDYEEILNAWSDKGPLYIHAGSPAQTVPDSDTHHDDFLGREICNVS